MLAQDQAEKIVRDSVGATTGRGMTGRPATLADTGITANDIGTLVETLVSHGQHGVPSFQHSLHPDSLADLHPNMRVDELVDKILRLSAGKLCSNPNNPHPQPCCPYPKTCAQCGYAVV